MIAAPVISAGELYKMIQTRKIDEVLVK